MWWSCGCLSTILCHRNLSYCFKAIPPLAVWGGLTIYCSPTHIVTLLPSTRRDQIPASDTLLIKTSLLGVAVSWIGVSFGLIESEKVWFKQCQENWLNWCQGKLVMKSKYLLWMTLGKDGQLSQSCLIFLSFFMPVWILIDVAWNTSILIRGYTLCLVKNGNDNFPGNGQCFRPSALLTSWLPDVFQSCTAAFYKPWNTVCKSNHLPKLVITKVNDLFIRTSTLALPHAVN